MSVGTVVDVLMSPALATLHSQIVKKKIKKKEEEGIFCQTSKSLLCVKEERLSSPIPL